MLKPIAGLPEGVIGIEAAGKVTGDDYESVLLPAIERGLQGRAKIRMLYHLGREFTGFTAGAMWDDAMLGLMHWKGFERCAVVTDATWIRESISLFRVLLPCPVRVYSNAEVAAAKEWINV